MVLLSGLSISTVGRRRRRSPKRNSRVRLRSKVKRAGPRPALRGRSPLRPMTGSENAPAGAGREGEAGGAARGVAWESGVAPDDGRRERAREFGAEGFAGAVRANEPEVAHE